MKLNHIPLYVVLFGLSAAHCEPADETRPPMTSQNATPPPQPTGGSGPSAPVDDNGGMYSSGEMAIGTEADGYDDDDPAAVTDFHAVLEPHGTWEDDTTYGTVWVPSTAAVGADFHPYVTAGHWVYDDDWVWASDYDWGWAPFHYGRWTWIEGRGWAWIPGRRYRGAWVMWGVDDGYSYLGWAPIPPTFVWFGGAAVAFPGYVGPRWVYCPRGDVFSPVVRTRIVVGAPAVAIASRVRPFVPATPNVVASGPPPQKLGFQAAQIPHASDAPAAGIARAQQFSRPSTAQVLGAHPPTRVSPVPAQAPRPAAVEQPRGAVIGQAPRATVPVQPSGPTTTVHAPHVVSGAPTPAPPGPVRTPAAGAYHAPSPTVRSAAPAPIRAAPMPRMGPAPSFRGGHR